MTSSQNHPRNDDAVLGGLPTAPVGSVVLGGWEGIQRRLSSDLVDQRIAALWELQKSDLQKSGQAGLDWLIQSLQDSSLRVQKVAYLLLQSHPETKAQQALQKYCPYGLFECLHTLTGHLGGVTAIAVATRRFRYRAEQEILASASRDGVIKVWDLQAREEMFSVNARTIVYGIAIDTNEEILVSKCKNQIVKAWSLRTEQRIRPPENRTRSIASVTVSQERHLISSSQNTIKVWDLQRGQEVCTLRGHSNLVNAVAVSEDQSLIVSGSEDRTVKIWGVE